ncbi:Hypothetical predicted protein [Marmota monax]|uniref:Uncharacterized protein n=1 Tax=Marmota monax TaxID=9995 RepID=A0A5E4BBR9_MARMO|nr:Hypothetical predicted protein [Marmota monax]
MLRGEVEGRSGRRGASQSGRHLYLKTLMKIVTHLSKGRGQSTMINSERRINRISNIEKRMKH